MFVGDRTMASPSLAGAAAVESNIKYTTNQVIFRITTVTRTLGRNIIKIKMTVSLLKAQR